MRCLGGDGAGGSADHEPLGRPAELKDAVSLTGSLGLKSQEADCVVLGMGSSNFDVGDCLRQAGFDVRREWRRKGLRSCGNYLVVASGPQAVSLRV